MPAGSVQWTRYDTPTRIRTKFMREFVSADAPCFALGLMEESKRRCGFVALRPGKAIPWEVSAIGFRFGHGLRGNDSFEVVHFTFGFHGFETPCTQLK
jgi:hypothetical protein